LQTQGSLRDGGLGGLLQTMQAERATGTLSLENGSDSASLYFLFGHLFHASGAGGQGEDVVVEALGWWDGSYHFDPRAKLPAEETIKSSPAELIAAAESKHAGVPAAAGAATHEQWPSAGVGYRVVDATTDAHAEAQAETPVTPLAEATPAESGLASWTAAQEEAPVPPAEPLAYTPYPAAAEPAPLQTERTTYPEPATFTTTPASDGAAKRTADAAVFYPLPAGRAHYEGLKAAFVDFPRLLRTLRADRHTGYVRLTGSGYRGVIILNEGQVRQAVSGNGQVLLDQPAFVQFRRQMDSGDGVLDVIELNGDTVMAITQLFGAPALFTGLLGRFVNLEALLEYLMEERVAGSVIVIGSTEMGVILLRDGTILGAYTESHPTLDQPTAAVAAIAGERSSRIEVKGGDAADVPAIDVESALSAPY